MNEKKLRIIGPVFLFIFLFIFFYGMFIKNMSTAAKSIAVSAFYAMLAWECSLRLIIFCRKRYPGIANTNKRLRYLFTIMAPVLLAISLIDQLFTHWISLYKALSWGDYAFIYGLNLMCALIITALYEGLYYIQNWQVLFAESEKIKKINLSNQFQLLKDQVKPHFLFNSLNTLVSLISSRPENAIRFTEELSSVYRYLLNKNLRELSTVREEVEFIRLYISMMQTRFQDALIIDIDITQETEETLLPPFVLQLLVENAIKHNIVSSKHPLKISICSDNDNITVVNNLQKKNSGDQSEKTGLLNLIERYRLLKKDHLLQIIEDGKYFRVMLPVLRRIDPEIQEKLWQPEASAYYQ